MLDIVPQITKELSLREFQVHNAVELLITDECTIPFVARYRKEKTGSLDEVALRSIRDRHLYLSELRQSIEKYLKVVDAHCQKDPKLKASFGTLKAKFENCQTKQELEDLYLPFKPKRRTRAQVAKEKGLEPLANNLMSKMNQITSTTTEAESFIAEHGPTNEALAGLSPEEALKGASDILAEQFAETASYRSLVRKATTDTGFLVASKIDLAKTLTGKELKKAQDKLAKYSSYFEYREPLTKAPAHRIMAVRRGEAEKLLKASIAVESEPMVTEILELITKEKSPTPEMKKWLAEVVEDCYKRLLSPSIETEVRLELKSMAEKEAIRVFSQNLEKLLLLPPTPNTVVLGVDPGLRTGSKLAAIDQTGKLLAHKVIYPIFDKPESPKTIEAKKSILKMIQDHKVNYLAIGNGTGGREINKLTIEVMKENKLDNVKKLFVNEAGASVYSTDEIAREEFPDLDPTIRSAVSIARRLQDPLAELVKIDPRSIGVGQYQHDINVTKLKKSLEEIVESCVNRVGVDINTASVSLLSYVSGVGPNLAKNIVSFRDDHGKFDSREQLQKITGLGPKAYTLAAGFLRVMNGTNPLDSSAVHPESYELVGKISTDLSVPLTDILGNQTFIDNIPLENYVSEEVGMPTLIDIAQELIKPGRDPREDNKLIEFSDDITEIRDLKVDMELQGSVTNVTNFGAFVDIGVHQDGLVHISELSNNFVKDPSTVVSVGDILTVRVIEVDAQRKRISLSCKSKQQPKSSAGTAKSKPNEKQGHSSRSGARSPKNNPKSSQSNRRPAKPAFTLDDLVNKFNKG